MPEKERRKPTRNTKSKPPPKPPPEFAGTTAANGHAAAPPPFTATPPPPAPPTPSERARLDAVTSGCTYASIQRQAQDWLIEGILPTADVVLVAGDTHSGKSTLFTSAAAHLSRGKSLVGGDDHGKLRSILYGREESASGAPLGRLQCENADLSYITAGDLRADGQPGPPLMLPDHERKLAERVELLRASLVVIDPLVSYMAPGLSAMDGSAVRAVLECLQAVARRTGACVATVAHLRKSREGTVWDWVSGTKEWVNVCRFVCTLGRDPRSAARRIIAMPKSPQGDGIPPTLYTLEKVPPGVQFRLGARAAIDADDMHGEPEDRVSRSAREQCRQYLRAMLACKLGLSVSTLRRAALDLGVTSHFVGSAGQQHWVWRRPEEWPE